MEIGTLFNHHLIYRWGSSYPLAIEGENKGNLRNRFEALADCTDELDDESSVSEGEENLFTNHLDDATSLNLTPIQVTEPRVTRSRNNLVLEQEKVSPIETIKIRSETQVTRGRGGPKGKKARNEHTHMEYVWVQ